ncbi:MAG: hypothetical protein L0387_11090 [Acidobacteria bacterium]|nr:hypothetical protein [Acidobacteriota bacterium]
MHALKTFIGFLREVLSENGRGSWSRVGSAVVVAALVYVIVATRSIPERTEELAWVLAALYGANQLGRVAQSFADTKPREKGGPVNRNAAGGV